jgi:hypothetical protein
MIDITLIDADQIVADQVSSRIEGTNLVEEYGYIKHCFNESRRNANTMLNEYYVTGEIHGNLTQKDINYPLNHLPEIIKRKLEIGIKGIQKYDTYNQFETTYINAVNNYLRKVEQSKKIFPSGQGVITKRNNYLMPHAKKFLVEIQYISECGEQMFENKVEVSKVYT